MNSLIVLAAITGVPATIPMLLKFSHNIALILMIFAINQLFGSSIKIAGNCPAADAVMQLQSTKSITDDLGRILLNNITYNNRTFLVNPYVSFANVCIMLV